MKRKFFRSVVMKIQKFESIIYKKIFDNIDD